MGRKIQIKKRCTGEVIFEYECKDNTMAATLIEAVKQKISLAGADFSGANFSRADFSGANFSGANFSRANFYGADFYEADFSEANFSGANFYGANFYGADFYEADFSGADFSGANFSRANFSEANFSGANFSEADFSGANFSGANFSGANFYGADFSRANFSRANFSRANFSRANFYKTKGLPYIPMVCPTDGSFIGWKKVREYLIKLEIPEDAERSSATTRKCRCSKAKVLSIININDNSDTLEEITNDDYNPYLTYKVGDMVYPDSWDNNRWNECPHGIHFFINKQEAINYY